MNIDFLKPVTRSGTVCLLIIVLLSTFLSFWKLGSHPLHEWDESWYAVITTEMMKRNDFVNYYFYEGLDYDTAKPPLYFWAVCLSYQLFGYEEFALRFPAALATVLFFCVFFQWVKKYTSNAFAFYSCLILFGCKAIIGYHVGRTGDTDAFVLLFLFLSLFYFSWYIDYEKKTSVLWCALFLGLAFYTKGIFALIFIPSMFIYAVWQRKLRAVLTDYRFWTASSLFMLIVFSWYFLVTIYGTADYHAPSGARNAFEQLLLHDTYDRFMQEGLGGNRNTGRDIFYYIRALDSNYNLWNYFFYILLLTYLFFDHAKIKKLFSSGANHFYILLAVFICIPFLLLTAAQTKLGWYLTPVTPLITLLTIFLTESVSKKFKVVIFLFIGLFAFTLPRHFIYLNSIPSARGTLIQQYQNQIMKSPVIYWYRSKNEMDWLAYFRWYAKEIKRIDPPHLSELVINDSTIIAGQLDEPIEAFLLNHPTLKVTTEGSYFITHR